jgi:hypothetical protein
MKYLRAYVKAFVTLFTGMGVVLFAIKSMFFQDFLADYFFYVVTVAAIGGPISVILNKKDVA